MFEILVEFEQRILILTEIKHRLGFQLNLSGAEELRIKFREIQSKIRETIQISGV